MKKTILALTLIITCAFLYAQNNKRMALVVGNAEYQNGNVLKNPVNDANLMSSTLKGLGFEVTKLTNATLKQMLSATISFTNKMPNYDVALFYYAGHGVQVNGVNYLVPIDAKMDDQLNAKYEAFDISDINNAFIQNNNKMNIMILDACRDNPFRSWMRGGNRGFKAIRNQSAGTIIAFATREGETASDGTGNNGLFTEKLVEEMKKPQDINSVFKKTRVAVLAATGNKQCPQEWDMTTGEFFFVDNKLAETIIPAKKTAVAEKKKTEKLEQYFTDPRDGKKYKQAKIGSQIWMAENLAYTGNNGTQRQIISDDQWMNNTNYNGWCYYENSSNNKLKYGVLYQWDAAMKACPNGWHLPTDAEWEQLAKYINGNNGPFSKQSDDWEGLGKFLKSSNGWEDNGNGSDNYGFSALSGGYRMDISNYSSIGLGGYWWSSTEYNSGEAWFRSLGYNNSNFDRYRLYKESGYSVRCVKN